MNSFIKTLGHATSRLLATASIYMFIAIGILYFAGNLASPKGSVFQGTIGFFACLVLCIPGGMFLDALEKKAKKLVELANTKEGLELNTTHLLGRPGHKYFAFDTKHCKIAIFNSANNTYSIKDFTYIRKWYTDHDTREVGEIGLGGAPIPGTPLRGPTHSSRTKEHCFRLVLEVNDLDHPTIQIPMRTNAEAVQWSARLGAILNS